MSEQGVRPIEAYCAAGHAGAGVALVLGINRVVGGPAVGGGREQEGSFEGIQEVQETTHRHYGLLRRCAVLRDSVFFKEIFLLSRSRQVLTTSENSVDTKIRIKISRL